MSNCRCRPTTGKETFVVGTSVHLEMELSRDDEDGKPVLIDAATVALWIRVPGQAFVQVPTVVHNEVGVYFTDYVVDVPGQYAYRWDSDNPESAKEGSFVVSRSKVLI